MKSGGRNYIESFDFHPGTILARKYEVISKLGEGWEGEVFRVQEVPTEIERTAKFFYPHRNKNRSSSTRYAKKLHKLRECPALIPYHVQEQIRYRGQDVTFLVSEYIEGSTLPEFLAEQPGKRLPVYQGLHLLYALTLGLEGIHRCREYHGDLHPGNIIIKRYGLGFDLKLLDMFHWGRATKENLQDDIVDAVKILYDAIGGQKHYAKHPQEIKDICCGLKRTLILKKFPTISSLREYLETMRWN